MRPEAPRVSVIVPVFNAASFLQDCVRRLIEQTVAAIEIILVDDGSTDGSHAIAATLAASDHRVAVLQQEHVGPGAARNRGLAAARAPYVTFVDSDDDMVADGCEALLRQADESGADVVVGKTDKWHRAALPSRLAPHPVAAIRALYTGRISTSACAKLYRRSFLRAHDIRFPTGMYIEDRHFLLQCLAAGASLASLERVVYRIHARPESTMHRITPKHATDATAACELDTALLSRAGLLRACGYHLARATLMVDLFVARRSARNDAPLRDVLLYEISRQERLFQRLPVPRWRRLLLTGVIRQLRRDLAGTTDFLPTRVWLRLLARVAP